MTLKPLAAAGFGLAEARGRIVADHLTDAGNGFVEGEPRIRARRLRRVARLRNAPVHVYCDVDYDCVGCCSWFPWRI